MFVEFLFNLSVRKIKLKKNSKIMNLFLIKNRAKKHKINDSTRTFQMLMQEPYLSVGE